jgi:two-component system OmpR family response regulator
MLTALDATRDVVAGLDAGANDYLTKPFEFAELAARVRAALRGPASHGSVARVGALTLDTASRAAFVDGAPLELTTKEFQLLEHFVAHVGVAVSRTRLVDSLWSDDDAPDSNALEVYVGNLRRKIGRGPCRPVIQTIRGFGYIFREG